MIVFALEFLQVRVVVVGTHAGMWAVDAFVFPRVGIVRRVADHIAHSAGIGCRGCDALLGLVGVPVAGILITVCPVRTIGIYVLAADDVQLVGLEVEGSMNLDSRTVDCGHRGLQLDDAGGFGHHRAGTKTAECYPSHAIIVDSHAGIEVGIRSHLVCPWRIVVDHQLLIGRFPGPDWRFCRQHANAVTRIAEVEEELVFAGLCIVSPGHRRCPRYAKALVPGTCHPSGADLLRVDGAVERPVHHVVGREDHDRLDFSIRVLALLAVGDELLVVVGAVDVEPSVVLKARRVGAEYAAADGIAIARSLVLSGQGLGICLQASHDEGRCHE